MGIALYFTSISILHCGGDEELRFINNLTKAVDEYENAPFTLEYTEFQKQQNKELVIYHDAEKYKKRKYALLVLISQKFFDLIWLTTYKQEILNVITSYPTSFCLHLWLDVSESDVRKYSTGLLRTDRYFRRTTLEELSPPMMKPAQMVDAIYNLLTENDDGLFNPLNNYAVDDEEEEMRNNFKKLNVNLVIGSSQKAVQDKSIGGENSKKGKKKFDSSKDIFRLQNMTYEELQTYTRERDAQIERHNVQASSKKRKKKKKTVAGGNRLLVDVNENDIERICTYLDQGPGANWKQIGECYRISANSLKAIDDNPAMSHTEQLIALLKKEKADIELSDFTQKCKDIMRFDVAAYISDMMT